MNRCEVPNPPTALATGVGAGGACLSADLAKDDTDNETVYR
ncbi:MAG: hypothetical protein ACRDRH_12375 [Pseudonocardia sp.]